MSAYKVVPDKPNTDNHGQVPLVNLRDTLNVNGGNVSDADLRTYFGAYNGCNPMAARKPIIVGGNTTIVDDMSAYNYGLSIAKVTGKSPLDLYDIVMGGDYNSLGYKYSRPTGGEAAPYRFSDFCGYWPNAISPITVLISGRMPYSGDNSALTSIRYPISGDWDFVNRVGILDGVPQNGTHWNIPTTAICPHAVGEGMSYRFGVLMYDPDNSSNSCVAFSQFPLANESTIDDTNLVSMYQGREIKFMPFISNVSSGYYPDGVLVKNINPNDWGGTECYALPIGVFGVYFDDSSNPERQDQYDRVRIVEFNGFYNKDGKTGVYARLILTGWGQQSYNPIYGLTISIHDANGNRLDFKSFGNVGLGANFDISDIYTAQFNTNQTFEGCTLRVSWGDGTNTYLQREIKIQQY